MAGLFICDILSFLTELNINREWVCGTDEVGKPAKLTAVTHLSYSSDRLMVKKCSILLISTYTNSLSDGKKNASATTKTYK